MSGTENLKGEWNTYKISVRKFNASVHFASVV
jgi:hypothetical protein